MAEAARESGAEAIVLPAENGPEAALVEGIGVIAVESLGHLPGLVEGSWDPPRPQPLPLRLDSSPGAPDLADLRGQPHLRHALEVAAAGGHSLLMVGPPGAGKSLAASRLPSILPPLAPVEALEVARIASACGRLESLPAGRPFRAPHHTISAAGLIGGGSPPRPGEATLPHRGVLFLDELCEFRRDALEALRAPLETGEVSIARAGGQRSLPCRFMLVAAANPCPCGRGETDPDCTCAPVRRAALPGQAERRARRSDRHPRRGARSRARPRSAAPPGEPSAAVRERVCAARERQEWRLGPGRCNAEMTPAEARACALSDEAALAAGRSLRAPAAQRPRPRPGAAPGPDPRRPGRGRGDRRGADGPGAADAEARTMAEPRACLECLRRSWLLAALGPYVERIATGEVGSRSPELLRLSNEELVEVAAPKVAAQLLARVAALSEAG